jgi:hypothetical protein
MITWPDITFGPINLYTMQKTLDLVDLNPAKEHDWKSDGLGGGHNGEYYYRCSACGFTDWIALYGSVNQLAKTPCRPGWDK